MSAPELDRSPPSVSHVKPARETDERCIACGWRIWRDLSFRSGKRSCLFGLLPHVPAVVKATCAACGRDEVFVAGTIRVSDLMSGDWSIRDTGLVAHLADLRESGRAPSVSNGSET